MEDRWLPSFAMGLEGHRVIQVMTVCCSLLFFFFLMFSYCSFYVASISQFCETQPEGRGLSFEK